MISSSCVPTGQHRTWQAGSCRGVTGGVLGTAGWVLRCPRTLWLARARTARGCLEKGRLLWPVLGSMG